MNISKFFLVVAVMGLARSASALGDAQFDLVGEVLTGESAAQNLPANMQIAANDPMFLPDTANKSKCRPQIGVASWYGTGERGNKTASGERFDPGAMTAANKTLPFGTRVKVTNRRSGRSVVVRINDRGPFIAGRVIDLSPAAATELKLDGIASVEVVCL